MVEKCDGTGENWVNGGRDGTAEGRSWGKGWVGWGLIPVAGSVLWFFEEIRL